MMMSNFLLFFVTYFFKNEMIYTIIEQVYKWSFIIIQTLFVQTLLFMQ